VLLEGTLARKKPHPKLTSVPSVAQPPVAPAVLSPAEAANESPELAPAASPLAAVTGASALPTGNTPGGAAPAGRWAPNTPFTVGRYRLEQELALGAYGATFSGRDLEAAPTAAAQQAARAVHVTLFHPAWFAEPRKKAQRERLERAMRYHSAFVAPTYAVGEAHSTMWAATAPIVGVPLTHWRRDAGAIRPDDVYRIVGQLLDAVAAIHREGGVHGSLSPETVRIVNDHAWVTSPWWLEPAEVPAGEVQPLRAAWMAPELLFGEHAEGAATDIYGVGLALGYLLACGLTEPGHSLLVQGIDVPPAVDDVYVRATARQKGSRYQDIASFRAALETAAGFEWRDAQKALRRGVGTGLVGLEVLEAGPARPRVGLQTTPPALPPRGNSGLLPLRPVVLSAMPLGGTVETPVGGFPQPAIVATESVLDALSGRSALTNEVERTSEDEALPAFEADGTPYGARALLEADGQTFGPSAAVSGAPDVVTSAPAIPGAPVTGSSRRPPEPLTPVSRRSASRVPTRTLQQGGRFGSGLASVLEIDFLQAPPEGAPGTGPRPRPSLDVSPQVDATDGLPAAAISEGMLRALMQPPELSSPPPLPGQTRPRWNASNPNWGSSLEALDADGPPDRHTTEVSVVAPLPSLPPLPPRARSQSATPAAARMAEPFPQAVEEFPDELSADEVGTAEPTVVEAIAQSLLEVDVFTPEKRAPAPIDLFAPPPSLPPDPWSDSPLVVTRGEGSSASLHLDALPVLHTPVSPLAAGTPSSRREMRPLALQSPAVAAAAAVAATLDKSISRTAPRPGTDPGSPALGTGGTLTGRSKRVQLETPIHEGARELRDEPRVIRDPSGPLAGSSATLSGIPIRGDGPMMRTDGPMVAPVARRRSRTLWLALGAVVVGAIVAFVALSSDGSGTGAGTGGSGELASIGPNGLGNGNGSLAGTGGLVIPLLGDRDATGPGGPAGPAETTGEGGGPDVSDGQVDAAPDGLADTGIAALLPPVALDVVTATEVAEEVGPIADANAVIADTRPIEIADVVVTPEVIAVPEVVETTSPSVMTAPSAFTPKDPAKLRCPDGMSKLKKKVPVTLADGGTVEDWEVVCIDRFEFPGAGAVPRTGVDMSGARAACIGKSKRLCTRSEWRRACGGQYPYGKDYDAERCNTAGADGTPHALAPAGSKKGCMSPSGAFDMVGNAAEWTTDGTVNGGTSLKNGEDATCNTGSKRAGGAPHVGFRCCVDAKE